MTNVATMTKGLRETVRLPQPPAPETSVVTTKGQIVIPAKIRRRLGIRKGTWVCFVEREEGIVLKAITDEYIDRIRGSLGTGGKVLKVLLEEKKKEREM